MVNKYKRKQGQVWVETVIYTLIALTIIGLFLTFARPKVEEIQDKATIEQSINMLEDVNLIINSVVEGGPENKRIIDLGIKDGKLIIDSQKDFIVFELEGKHEFTQPGKDVQVGSIIARTEDQGRIKKVTLISNYSGVYNISYQNKEEAKTLNKAPVPYKLSIANKGTVAGKTLINTEVLNG